MDRLHNQLNVCYGEFLVETPSRRHLLQLDWRDEARLKLQSFATGSCNQCYTTARPIAMVLTCPPSLPRLSLPSCPLSVGSLSTFSSSTRIMGHRFGRFALFYRRASREEAISADGTRFPRSMPKILEGLTFAGCQTRPCRVPCDIREAGGRRVGDAGGCRGMRGAVWSTRFVGVGSVNRGTGRCAIEYTTRERDSSSWPAKSPVKAWDLGWDGRQVDRVCLGFNSCPLRAVALGSEPLRGRLGTDGETSIMHAHEASKHAPGATSCRSPKMQALHAHAQKYYLVLALLYWVTVVGLW